MTLCSIPSDPIHVFRIFYAASVCHSNRTGSHDVLSSASVPASSVLGVPMGVVLLPISFSVWRFGR
jgi:hypothetical protein